MRPPRKRGWCVAISIVRRCLVVVVCLGTLIPTGVPAVTTKVHIYHQTWTFSLLGTKPNYIIKQNIHYTNSLPQRLWSECGTVLAFDNTQRQLARWGIPFLIAVAASGSLLIVLLVRLRKEDKILRELLRHKELELAETQSIAEIGSWTWEPKTDVFFFSESFANLIGIDRLPTVTHFRQLSQFFTPDSWESMIRSTDSVRGDGGSFELELQSVHTDGTLFWLSVRGQGVRDNNGTVAQLRGTMRNISERKQSDEVKLRHAAIVESSEDAIISKDLNGTIQSWNAGAERIFGYTQAEVAGQSITMIIPPELLDEERTILQKVKAGERIDHYETIRVTKDGKRVDISLTISPVRDLSGRIVGASKIARDITARKQVEKDLKRSEEMFAKAFREGPIAIILTDAKTERCIDVNRTFECFSGYRREDVIGRTTLDAGICVDPDQRMKLIKKVLAEEHLRDVEVLFRTKDGQIRITQVSAELIEIGDKRFILSFVSDITDRKRAELALMESEKRFRLMADSAPVLMWLTDIDKRCTDVNKEWLRFTGKTMLEELGEGWMDSVHPDDLETFQRRFSTSLALMQSFTVEFRLRRYDGRYCSVRNNSVPRFLGDGSLTGYIGCCIDITNEKEAKVTREEFSGRLIHAQEEERARIARELHDDINQRLALLANGLENIKGSVGSDGESTREEALQELLHLTTEIATDIQHLSHRLHPSKLHYLGLAAAARDLCQEFSRQHKIEVECIVHDLPRNLSEDASLNLYRAIQECLHNVAKHSQARHVRVELTRDSTILNLRISDDGIGFDPTGISDKGLGLISMRERLRSVGGQLSVWSRPSLGTQLEGTVPITMRHSRSEEAKVGKDVVL